MATQRASYRRFTPAQRLEHWVMTLSFTVLVITGLPQRYALSAWAEMMITAMGGIESVRIIHRIAAVVFVVVMIYHFIVVAYKIFVLRVGLSMMPTLQDGKDMVNAVRYYLGRLSDHPKLPRYNYTEKMEYWAVIWGGILMTLTGFMLWNPIATTNIFPGQFVPAARTAHSAEALLAFLAIIIWHVYWVHLKTFNRSMFTGALTRKQMQLEHAAELEQIEAGQTRPPVSPVTRRRRERIFAPLMAVGTTAVVIGLYYFATFEQTAITTIPPAEAVQAFIPATPTPTRMPQPTATPTATPIGGELLPVNVPMTSHRLDGREDCFECHAADGPIPNPKDHTHFDLSLCNFCHSTESDKLGPSPLTHKLVKREECTRCHDEDLQPESHWTAGFSDEDCLLCHQPIKDSQ